MDIVAYVCVNELECIFGNKHILNSSNKLYRCTLCERSIYSGKLSDDSSTHFSRLDFSVTGFWSMALVIILNNRIILAQLFSSAFFYSSMHGNNEICQRVRITNYFLLLRSFTKKMKILNYSSNYLFTFFCKH